MPAATLDLTGIATAVIAGLSAILAVVIPLIMTKYMGNTAASVALKDSIANSVGAIQQAADNAIVTAKPVVTIPGVPLSLVPGVQFVLDHAGAEAARFGITPPMLADRISAQLGLAKLKVAVSAANAAPATIVSKETVPVNTIVAPQVKAVT
jgi:hypothetical protein